MRTGCKFAVLALLAGSFFLITSSSAQVNAFGGRTFGGATIRGTPPSVTSLGFGGHPGFHGVPPSVTSLGFGNAPFHSRGFGLHQGPFRDRRHRRGEFVTPFFGGAYYLPYGYDYDDNDPGYSVMDPGVDDSMEQGYGPGPTIFDRSGAGAAEYARPRPPAVGDDYRAGLNPEPAQSVADQPDTILIFKDGHQVEIKNYAI